MWPLSLLFSKPDKPKVLSCSSQNMPSRLLTSFVALLWTHSRTFSHHSQIVGPRTAHRAQGEPTPTLTQWDNPLFRPAGCAVSDATQGGVCPPGCQATGLAPVEPAAGQHHQVPFCRAALQPLLSQFILVPSTTLPQVQNAVLGLVKFCAINHCPVLQCYLDPSPRPPVHSESPQHLPVWCHQQTC